MIQVKKILAPTALFISLISTTQAFASAHAVVQVGGFYSSQGQAQHINIQDLIGDTFNVTGSRNHFNALFGLGALFDGLERDRVTLNYGVNAFYFLNTQVNGTITQEDLFTNLAYRYNISYLPIYAALKALFNSNSKKYAFTLDAGIGPNIIFTNSYHDYSIDGGITLPDNAFKADTQVAFTVMAGVGFLVHVSHCAALELGYRFFYLGQGALAKNNTKLLNTLNTGNNYANALILSAIF